MVRVVVVAAVAVADRVGLGRRNRALTPSPSLTPGRGERGAGSRTAPTGVADAWWCFDCSRGRANGPSLWANGPSLWAVHEPPLQALPMRGGGSIAAEAGPTGHRCGPMGHRCGRFTNRPYRYCRCVVAVRLQPRQGQWAIVVGGSRTAPTGVANAWWWFDCSRGRANGPSLWVVHEPPLKALSMRGVY